MLPLERTLGSYCLPPTVGICLLHTALLEMSCLLSQGTEASQLTEGWLPSICSPVARIPLSHANYLKSQTHRADRVSRLSDPSIVLPDHPWRVDRELRWAENHRRAMAPSVPLGFMGQVTQTGVFPNLKCISYAKLVKTPK